MAKQVAVTSAQRMAAKAIVRRNAASGRRTSAAVQKIARASSTPRGTSGQTKAR